MASPRALRAALGGLWLLDGGLQLQPAMFTHRFVSDVLLPQAGGQPALLRQSIAWGAHLVGAHVGAWNGLFSAIQLLIGAALVCDRHVRPALWFSFAWCIGVWWVGEGFGGLLTGGASLLSGAPGAVILYAIVGVAAWPTDDPATRARAASAVRCTWALVWVGGGILQLASFDRIAPQLGQASLARLVGPYGAAFAAGLAAAEIAVGLGPFFAATAKASLIAGASLSLVFWWAGQHFGDLSSGVATDPGSGPLFILLVLALARRGDQVRGFSRLLLGEPLGSRELISIAR